MLYTLFVERYLYEKTLIGEGLGQGFEDFRYGGLGLIFDQAEQFSLCKQHTDLMYLIQGPTTMRQDCPRRASVNLAPGGCTVTRWGPPHPQASVWRATTASTVWTGMTRREETGRWWEELV